DAVVASEHAAGEIDDVAGLGGTWQQPLDHLGVATGRDETDVLTVVFVCDRKTEPPRELARLRLGAFAEREAQDVELLGRGREQKIALVTLLVAGAIEPATSIGKRTGCDVVPRRERPRAQLAGGAEQIVKLDRLVAVNAWHRRLAGYIALGE